MSNGTSTKSFQRWFAGFARNIAERDGVEVTIRDSNATLYRNLFDRGHTPEGAARLMS